MVPFETWLQRVVVTGICWLVGQVAVATVGNAVTVVSLPVILWWPAASLLWGTVIALGQWLLLRPPVKSVMLWVAYSVGAFSLGLALAALLFGFVNHPLVWLLGGTLAGAAFGFGQALALEASHETARQWTTLTTTGWLVAYGLSAVVPQNGAASGVDILGMAAGGGVGWGVAAIIGVILMVMLYPREEPKDPTVRWWPKRGVTWSELFGMKDKNE